ncbi:MAG: asparagine synthase (glutamine-hydrolyzing), partial [Myxococcota bacterium]
MCGIAGIYAGAGDLACPSLLLQMAGELHHRGPDGSGLYLDGRFGMANTRLSIIDIEGGDQPLGTEDGRFWVMQNGEIYNFPELRAELESLGHVFSTRSDTEVLAHAYEQWGAGCLPRLNGEFAFAVWDTREQELFLARDRFGIRPLFLADYGQDLCFASEIKALLRHSLARRELDPAALTQVFTLWTTLPERSSFSGVRELPPGHFLRVSRDGRCQLQRWWELPFVPSRQIPDRSASDLAEELRALLQDATRIRLRADVPVAVYVSGGLDSSATTAMAAKYTRGGLTGFGIGFADPCYDESVHQKRMGKAL